ncbi:MAG: hypothetical protein ACP6IP_06890 [Candidatus Njordarchaeia archaeon]
MLNLLAEYLNERKKNIFLYFAIASMVVVPLPVFPAYALSNNPTFSPVNGWYDIPNGYKTKYVYAYNSWGGYAKYKMSIWVKQLTQESSRFYDYYGISVRLQLVDTYRVDRSILRDNNPSETKLDPLNLIVHPTNIKHGLIDYAFPESFSPTTGDYYLAFDGQIRVAKKIGGTEFTIVWNIKLYGIHIKAEDYRNRIEWTHTRTWVGQVIGASVLGSQQDGRWLAIFAVPNFHEGYPNGILTFSFNMDVYMGYTAPPGIWFSGTYSCAGELTVSLYDIN